jgi:chromosome segregation ATPase
MQVTDIAVKLDPETGAATIELRGAAVAEPRFRLRDIATEKFLTRRGWSKTPSFLPGEAVTAADFTVLALDADLARRVSPGMNLSLEQPASNIFATLSWPQAAATEQAEDEKAEQEAAEEETAESDERLPEADQEMADAAEADAAELADDTDEPAAPEDKPAAVADEPASLEPTIRDEATTQFRPDPAPAAARTKPLSIAPVDHDDDDDEDEPRTPWGKLAAAAVFFLVLGSVLTYFWQSSAYDNELRTAMRAVEAQRDQDKAEFEKRLAEAEANAGKATDQTVTAANAKVASLTTQTTDLIKDRDEALSEVSEQQAKVKTLEERLSTAQGEIESLKAAAEATATEQTAVFNERIDALGKELDAARSELERNRAEVASREQALATSAENLRKANTEIAALKKAADDQQVAQTEEVEGRITSLSSQLDKAAQDLSARDASLRDVQSKLSVANVQIEALKQVAGKATEADLERTTLADRITELTGQIDEADKQLLAKEEELKKAKTSLDAANALLASNADELEKLKTAADTTETAEVSPQADPDTARLKQERDLFAKELSAMTESFNALKAERDRLADAAGKIDQQTASLDTAAATSDSRAIWGATAIDQAGAIYSLQNQIAEKTATENVVALCKGKSNGRCEPLRTYSKSCFSLARIDGEGPRNDNFGFAVDTDWQAAESSAKRQCEELGANCTVRFTACSPDALSKPAANQ